MLWINRAEQDEEGEGELERADRIEEEEEDESSQDSGNGVDKNKASRISTLSDFGQSRRRRSVSARRWGAYPVVVNFHGGGFTLGSSGDDARWCGTVVNECHAVVVSVDYRLAPECPFPTAVEDGVDAVLYIHKHADELGIDKDKIALSGFSSGGNMTFTVPLRLYDDMQGFPRDDIPLSRPPTQRQKAERAINGSATSSDEHNAPSASSSSTKVADGNSNVQILDHDSSAPPLTSEPQKTNTISTITEAQAPRRPHIPTDIKIACLIPWYPPVDYTRTREQRRATCKRADQELPALFTDLFDESYLHPPHTISLDSPYLSPGVAPTDLLRAALPQEIIMHTCEWDMLLSEGEDFYHRLITPTSDPSGQGIGKKVWYKMVEGVPHGWDKAPNPWKPTPGVREHYLRACKEMRRVFGPEKGQARPPMERGTTKGWPTVAPRGSINVVR